MYAITGITGKVGGALAQTLLSANQPVRAVVRDPGRAQAWAERGCEVAAGRAAARESERPRSGVRRNSRAPGSGRGRSARNVGCIVQGTRYERPDAAHPDARWL
jgi:hypothetical protein